MLYISPHIWFCQYRYYNLWLTKLTQLSMIFTGIWYKGLDTIIYSRVSHVISLIYNPWKQWYRHIPPTLTVRWGMRIENIIKQSNTRLVLLVEKLNYLIFKSHRVDFTNVPLLAFLLHFLLFSITMVHFFFFHSSPVFKCLCEYAPSTSIYSFSC